MLNLVLTTDLISLITSVAALLPTTVAAVGNATIVSTAAWYIDVTCSASAGTWTAQQVTVTPL